MPTTMVRRRHRPASVTVTIGVLVFLGVTAVGGGVELVFNVWGAAALPAEWLDRLPLIDSWLVPGLVLGIGFGLGSLLTAYGMLARPDWAWTWPVAQRSGHHWSWAASIGLGLGMVAWIALEVFYLPGRSWLEVLYGGIGIALVLLPVLPSVSHHLRERHR